MSVIALTELPRALRQAGFEPPSYKMVYSRALTAAIPAERLGRNWIVKIDDLANIAEIMNLPKLEAVTA